MDDITLGRTVRLLRRRRGWRQSDLAARSGCVASTVSLLERGHLEGVSVKFLRQIGHALDMRIDIVPRWRGGELDRILGRGHAQMHEAFARYLADIPGWVMRPEVSFAMSGERGVIDVLAWHAASRMLLIVELKTQLVDLMDLLSTMDRRRRLGPRLGAELGWAPASVATLVVLEDGRTNRRRVAEHRTVLRVAFPADGRRMDGWLRDPTGPIAMLALWARPDSAPTAAARGGSMRVRVRAGMGRPSRAS